jgi:hypothetical protein
MVDGPEVMATTVARVESSVVTVARERAEMPWLRVGVNLLGRHSPLRYGGRSRRTCCASTTTACRAPGTRHTNSASDRSGHQGDDIQQTAFTPCAGQTCPEAVLPAAVEAEAEAEAEAQLTEEGGAVLACWLVAGELHLRSCGRV